jgi:hypothetical protein
MTTFHPTSCTECEELKLGNCQDCDMAKWRTAQNILAYIVSIEMIITVSLMVFWAVSIGAGTESLMKFGDRLYAAKIAGALTFIGMVVLFAIRDYIMSGIMWFARYIEQRNAMMADNDEEEDEEE